MEKGVEADPWFGLQPIEADELYPTIEEGITRLDMAAKMEHPILEEDEIVNPPPLTIVKQGDVVGWGVIYSGTNPLQKGTRPDQAYSLSNGVIFIGQFMCIYKGAVKTKLGLEQTHSTRRYLTQLDSRKQIYVDADVYRNIAGFINHSHDPNCDLGVENYNGIQVVVVRAARLVTPNEFLSLDYGWISADPNELSIACQCGADNCPGTLFQPSLIALIEAKHGLANSNPHLAPSH